MPVEESFKSLKKRSRTYFTVTIWQDDPELPGWRRSLRNLLRILTLVVTGYRKHQCQSMAGALTFRFLLAIIPSLAVFLVLFKGPLLEYKGEILQWLLDYMAPAGELQERLRPSLEAYIQMVQESLARGQALHASIGIIMLVTTATLLLHQAEKSLNRIWGVKRSRPFFEKFTIYWSVATIGPVLFVLSFSLASNTLVSSINRVVPIGTELYHFVLAVCFTFTAFTVIYLWLPNAKISFRAGLTGGLFAGATFEICKWGFINVSNLLLTNWSQIYGSISILFIVLVWTYLCFNIILLGAEFAHAAENVRHITIGELGEELSQEGREGLALRVMTLLGRRFRDGTTPVNLGDLVRSIGVPLSLVKEVVNDLEDSELLLLVDEGCTPARALERISAWDIVRALRIEKGGLPRALHPDKGPTAYREAEEKSRLHLERITIPDLLKEADELPSDATRSEEEEKEEEPQLSTADTGTGSRETGPEGSPGR